MIFPTLQRSFARNRLAVERGSPWTLLVTQGRGASENVTWAGPFPGPAWHLLSRKPACVRGPHAPEMSVNLEPKPEGVAITHGLMSSGNWAEQVPSGELGSSTFVQTIPTGELVMSPVPVPANP